MTAVEDVPISAGGNPIGFGSMKRVEDQRFVRGQGNYVDDVNLPGMLHSAILRSPYAHARIKSIDTSAAEALPGVHAVITGAIPSVDTTVARFFGGTGLLIAVSVAFDLVQKIDSHLVMRNYKGLLET